MPAWLIWLIVAGVFAAAETFNLALVLVMFAGGAAAAAVVAAAGGPAVLQFLVAIAATLALLGVVRPVARRHLTVGSAVTTGTDKLVGMQAVVLNQVDEHGGRVRLNGAEWSARSFDPMQIISAGTVVRVMEIAGASAVVWQEPSP